MLESSEDKNNIGVDTSTLQGLIDPFRSLVLYLREVVKEYRGWIIVVAFEKLVW